MVLWGRLWSTNMLVFERTHIALRGMARSSKCMFTSILLNYVNYLAAQTVYRFSDTQFANTPKASSLTSRVGVVEALGHCVPSAVATAPNARFSDKLFCHIMDLWILNTTFERHRNSYIKQMELIGIDRQYAILHMSEWTPPTSIPQWAKQRFQVNRKAKVCVPNVRILYILCFLCLFGKYYIYFDCHAGNSRCFVGFHFLS